MEVDAAVVVIAGGVAYNGVIVAGRVEADTNTIVAADIIAYNVIII